MNNNSNSKIVIAFFILFHIIGALSSYIDAVINYRLDEFTPFDTLSIFLFFNAAMIVAIIITKMIEDGSDGQ